jgi:hypothetical protein
MHSAYEHPKKIFSTVFLQRDYFNFFYNKNVAKQRGPPPPEDAEKSGHP